MPTFVLCLLVLFVLLGFVRWISSFRKVSNSQDRLTGSDSAGQRTRAPKTRKRHSWKGGSVCFRCGIEKLLTRGDDGLICTVYKLDGQTYRYAPDCLPKVDSPSDGSLAKEPIHSSGTNAAEHSFDTAAVGESFYQDAFVDICGEKTKDGVNMIVKAQLVMEDFNDYDKNAVRVEVEGKQVGYLSRSDAKRFRRRYAEDQSCNGIVAGGWDDGDGNTGQFGIKLDIELKK